MGDLLGFFGMADDYEDRAVARHEDGDLVVDTAAVSDSEQPFETGVRHPQYREGSYVIVEMYDTREEAEAGHAKWVKTMTAKKPPTYLRDVSSAGIKRLGETLGAFPEYDKFERGVA